MYLHFQTDPIVLNYTRLICGVTMIIASLLTFRKIKNGSQSNFAYVLVAFTLLCGVQDTCRFFIESLRYPETAPDGSTIYLLSFKAIVIDNGVYVWTALQTWIFAMKYLESSLQMSGGSIMCSPSWITCIMWTVIILFTIDVAIVVGYQIGTFPGQQSADGTFIVFKNYLAD